MAVTTVGRFFGWFGKSARAARSSARAARAVQSGGVLTGRISTSLHGFNFGKGVGKITKDGSKVFVAKNATLWKGGKIIKAQGVTGKWVPWTSDMVLVSNKLPAAVKTSRGARVLEMAGNIPIPAGKTSFRLGVFAVVGYTAWRTLGIVGTVSDAAEETINNFFGINCDESDTACQEQGAKNMLMTGVIVAALGVGGIVLLTRKPKAQEIKVVSDTGAAA